MKFTEEDYFNLLKTISKQREFMELFYKGWTDFSNNMLKPYTQSEQCQPVSNLLAEQGETNMKYIIKRKDGRYMIRKTIDSERITKYARTLAEAKIILKNFNNGKIKPTKKERIKNYTLKEYGEIWLKLYKKSFVSAKTYSAIKGYINRMCNTLGSVKLRNITAEDLQEFLNTIPRSRNKEKMFSYYNSIFQKAVDTQIIAYNPFVAVIKDKKVKCKNDAYTYYEQVQILNAIKNTDIEHEIYVYLMCGCRPNELPTKANFDFINNIINIYGTKNDNAKHRQIEMSEKFSQYMQAYLSKFDIQAEKYVSNKFISICKSIGIQKPLLYKLRHTFATNHFTLGTQPKIVQHWLGHSSISMTLDTYTDIDKTATKDKIIALYNNFYYIKN